MDTRLKGTSVPTVMTPPVMVKTLEDFQASDGTSIKKATLLVAFEKAEGPNKATLYHCEGKHGKPRVWIPLSNVALAAKEKLYEVHYFKERDEEEKKRKQKEDKAKKEKEEHDRKEKEKRDEKERKEKEKKEKDDKKKKKDKGEKDKDSKSGSFSLHVPDSLGSLGKPFSAIGDKLFTPREDSNVEISAPTPVSSSVPVANAASVTPADISGLSAASSRASVKLGVSRPVSERPPPPNRPPPPATIHVICSGSGTSLSVPSSSGSLGPSPRSWNSTVPLSATSSQTSLSTAIAESEQQASASSNAPKRELPSVPAARKSTLTMGQRTSSDSLTGRSSGDFSKPLPQPPAGGSSLSNSTQQVPPPQAPLTLDRSQKPLPPQLNWASGDYSKPLPPPPAATLSVTPALAAPTATDDKRAMLKRMHADKAMNSTLRLKQLSVEKTEEDAKTQKQMEQFVKKALPPTPHQTPKRTERAAPETAKIEEQGKTIVEALLKAPAKPPAPAPPPPPIEKKKQSDSDKNARLNILPPDNLEELFEIEKDATLNLRGAILRWRIEGLLPVARNVADIQLDPPHVFCAADCYLVLKTPDVDSGTQFVLHYWIGSRASADKIGSVAIRATQLNQLLGGVCKHQREDEGHESSEFAHYYFKTGQALEVTQEGGTESAFRSSAPPPHVSSLYRCLFSPPNRSELLRVPLAFASLSADLPYLFDLGEKLLVLESNAANKTAKFYTRDMAQLILATDRRAKGDVTVISEAQREAQSPEYAAICRLLGCERVVPLPATKPNSVIRKKLYKVAQGEDGKLACDVVWEHEVTNPTDLAPVSIPRELLSPDHTFILDCATELYYWFGKRSSPRVRKVTVALAAQLLSGEEDRPEWVTIVPVIQDSESTLFKRHFADWVSFHRDLSHAKELTAVLEASSAAKASAGPRQFTSEDYMQLLSHPVDITEPWLPIEGVTQVWYITKAGNKNVTLPEKERGHFYSAECYLVLHVFSDKGSAQKSILYFWQGAEAGPRTWPSFQLSLAPMIDKTITAGGHPAPQRLRLMQGRESAHFLHLFGLRLVVHRGTRPPKGIASANGLFETRVLPLPPTRPKPKKAKDAKDAMEKEPKEPKASEAKPSQPEPTHYAFAIQVANDATSLKSNQHFLLRTDSALFRWRGQLAAALPEGHSPLDALIGLLSNGAANLAVHCVAEGDASEESFYAAVAGGRKKYTDVAFWSAHPKPARLFRFSNLLAEWSTAEVRHYMQYDLSSSEMASLLLDTLSNELFLWTPTQLTEQAMAAATALARQYLAEAQKAGRKDVRLVPVEENKEDIEFTAHFFGWYRKETFKDPYAEREAKMLQEMREQARLQAAVEAEEAERRRVELAERNAALKAKQRTIKLRDWQSALLARLSAFNSRLAAIEAAQPAKPSEPAAPATASPVATTPVSALASPHAVETSPRVVAPSVPAASAPTAVARTDRASALRSRQESILATLASLSRRVDSLAAPVVTPPPIIAPAPPASPAIHVPVAQELITATKSVPAAPTPFPTPASFDRGAVWLALMQQSDLQLLSHAEPEVPKADELPVEMTPESSTSSEPTGGHHGHKSKNVQQQAREVVQVPADHPAAGVLLLWYSLARHAPPLPEPAPSAAVTESEKPTPSPTVVIPADAPAPATVQSEAPDSAKLTAAPAEAASSTVTDSEKQLASATPKARVLANGPSAAHQHEVMPAQEPASAPTLETKEVKETAVTDREVQTTSREVVAEPPVASVATQAHEAAPATPEPAVVPSSQPIEGVAAPTEPTSAANTEHAASGRPSNAAPTATEPAPDQAETSAPAVPSVTQSDAPTATTEPTAAPSDATKIAPAAAVAEPAAVEHPAPALASTAASQDVSEQPKAPTDETAPHSVPAAEVPAKADKATATPPTEQSQPAAESQAESAACFGRLLKEFAVAGPDSSVSAPDMARVIFVSMETLFADTSAIEALQRLLSAQLAVTLPTAGEAPPRGPFYWLSVASHLLYFLYSNSLSPLPSPSPPAATQELAAAISRDAHAALISLAQHCALQVSALSLVIVRSGNGSRSKELSAMISEYHNYLARDANLRFTFTRFFMHVYSQVDVNVFNDLLRGSVSCGVGIVLKAVLTELTMWTKAVNLPPAVADSLQRLRQTADVLVMVKSPLVERNVRDAVCPGISPAQLWRFFDSYQPDEFDHNTIHPSIVELLRTLCDLEVQKKQIGDASPAAAIKPPPPVLETLLLPNSSAATSPLTKEEIVTLTTIPLKTAALPTILQSANVPCTVIAV